MSAIIIRQTTADLVRCLNDGIGLTGYRLVKINDNWCGPREGWLIESIGAEPSLGNPDSHDLTLVVWVGDTMVDMTFSTTPVVHGGNVPELTLGYDS